MSDSQSDLPGEPTDQGPYRVLARKYRPQVFSDLIGQESLVRTLTNALESGRMAQAFMLTGVRGVGKTTTARIIARALNCVGPEGGGGATTEPCGVCPQCRSIAEDRHVDVLEMDAASRTGVGDIRELIESVRYRPVEARRKVYIIDEVHMLSTAAFNALLKTLEEPPEHVTFIFATTEIRKVPVTVLSRCQRFDLRRLEQADLLKLLAGVSKREGVAAEDGALKLIARAADGSARDGLSLLDQAMALGGGKQVTEAEVHAMLGLADRTRVFTLLEGVLKGAPAEVLELLDDLYRVGADPAVVIQDLLELTHLLTRAKLTPDILRDAPEAERTRGAALAEALSIPELTRIWQLLLKGLGEVRGAPNPRQAAEMVLVRLVHASRLPSPGELVRQLQDRGAAAPAVSASAKPIVGGGPSVMATPSPETAPSPQTAPGPQMGSGPAPLLKTEGDAPPQPSARPQIRQFEAVVALAEEARSLQLASQLRRDLHLVHFEPGRIEFRPGPRAPAGLAQDLSRFLAEATGERWMVSVSQEKGAPSLQEAREVVEDEKRDRALRHPLARATLEAFPGANLVSRREKPNLDQAIEPPPGEYRDDGDFDEDLE